MRDGAEQLKEKIVKYQPRIAVFNGKGENMKYMLKREYSIVNNYCKRCVIKLEYLAYVTCA